jgi:hypothetical protein
VNESQKREKRQATLEKRDYRDGKLGSVGDSIREALENGYCSSTEIIRFCISKDHSDKSVYKALPREVDKWGRIVKMKIQDERDKGDGYLRQQKRRSTNVFVLWSSALETLFNKVDKSSFGDFEPCLSESTGRVFSIDMKARKNLNLCSSQVAIVSCSREPKGIARFEPNTQPLMLSEPQVKQFPFFSVQEDGQSLSVYGEVFSPTHQSNVLLFSLNCRGSFLYLPYFLNLKSNVGPCRILGIERKGVTTSFGGE